MVKLCVSLGKVFVWNVYAVDSGAECKNCWLLDGSTKMKSEKNAHLHTGNVSNFAHVHVYVCSII